MLACVECDFVGGIASLGEVSMPACSASKALARSAKQKHTPERSRALRTPSVHWERRALNLSTWAGALVLQTLVHVQASGLWGVCVSSVVVGRGRAWGCAGARARVRARVLARERLSFYGVVRP
eukprot:6463402-Prymnesium_polylepis.1